MVHTYRFFEALQLYIKWIPVVVREPARKYGKSGDFEVAVLTFICVVAAVKNKYYLYSSIAYYPFMYVNLNYTE